MSDFRMPVFQGTAAQPGTGWFDREGIERPKHGEFSEGKYAGKPYSMYTPPCRRCGGVGGADQWKHTGWKCYDCGGSGRGETRPIRLFTADELAVLNARRDVAQAKRQAKRAAEAAKIKAEQEASAAARKAFLEADPFYQDFQDLYQSFNPYTVYDTGWDADDKRPMLPDFLRKMWALIQHTDLSDKQRSAVQKFIDTRKAQVRRQEGSHFVGDVGDRIEVDAVVLFTKTIHYGEGYYDPSRYLIKLERNDGNVLTWFTQKCYEKGERLIGRATVKDHKQFNGMCETQITNFRIKEVLDTLEEVPEETPAAKPAKEEPAMPVDENPNACRCGSGQDRRALVDARGIFVAYVCNACEGRIRKKYRPEIFTDSRYATSEPVEPGDSYGAPGF